MVCSLIIILGPLGLEKFNQYTSLPGIHCWGRCFALLVSYSLLIALLTWIGFPEKQTLRWRFACKRIIEECSGGHHLWGVRVAGLGRRRRSAVVWLQQGLSWCHRELQSTDGTSEPPQMEAFVAALISYLMSGLSREEHGLPVATSFSQGLLPDRVLTVNCQWPTLL